MYLPGNIMAIRKDAARVQGHTQYGRIMYPWSKVSQHTRTLFPRTQLNLPSWETSHLQLSQSILIKIQHNRPNMSKS